GQVAPRRELAGLTSRQEVKAMRGRSVRETDDVVFRMVTSQPGRAAGRMWENRNPIGAVQRASSLSDVTTTTRCEAGTTKTNWPWAPAAVTTSLPWSRASHQRYA